ncbi:MAG TPA: hypothetical protein VNI02_05115 [Blastocatellia bacterium]|jgi:hypothetical protein|nr:hypothetical protein [Blastocatellia bacterium]
MKKPKYKHLKKPDDQGSGKSVTGGRDAEGDMLDDYSFLDWSKAERGKYAERYAGGTNLVPIAPDLIDIFPNAESVNRALHAMAEVIRASSVKVDGRKRVTSRKAK